MKYFFAALVLFTGMFLIGCRSSKTDENKGSAEMVTTPSGLKYVDMTTGQGDMPKVGQEATINYIMSVQDGKTIENTYKAGKPYKIRIGSESVMKGLEEGVSTMRRGGRRVLYLPPELAYGDRAIGDVPANATIVIDVELVDFK